MSLSSRNRVIRQSLVSMLWINLSGSSTRNVSEVPSRGMEWNPTLKGRAIMRGPFACAARACGGSGLTISRRRSETRGGPLPSSASLAAGFSSERGFCTWASAGLDVAPSQTAKPATASISPRGTERRISFLATNEPRPVDKLRDGSRINVFPEHRSMIGHSRARLKAQDQRSDIVYIQEIKQRCAIRPWRRRGM